MRRLPSHLVLFTVRYHYPDTPALLITSLVITNNPQGNYVITANIGPDGNVVCSMPPSYDPRVMVVRPMVVRSRRVALARTAKMVVPMPPMPRSREG